MKSLFLLVSLVFTTVAPRLSAETPAAIPLWSGGAPGSETRKDEPEKIEGSNITNVHHPSITPYLPDPDKATGTAVIVCPGGGHAKLCVGHEGYALCEWFREQGIAAFLLKYRLSREEGSPYTLEGHAMDDTRRAIRTVRSRAKEWGIRPDRIGVLGFSAGGGTRRLRRDEAAGGRPGGGGSDRPSREPPRLPRARLYRKSDTFTAAPGMSPVFIACGYDDTPRYRQGHGLGLPQVQGSGGEGRAAHLRETPDTASASVPAPNTAAGRWVDRFREWLADSGLL